jgi:iron complex outermembrane receptor protein
MTRLLSIFVMMASISTLAVADEDSDSSGHYFAEFPVVLSASRLVQPAQEAPAAVTVIDREMIRNSGARQIAELFRLVPGFLITYRNGHSPAVTYHGLADTYARRLQVMIDGVSVYSPLYGGVEWYDLPIAIEDIERIEIVRGPNGASFGANAFVGMVNIITREPAVGDPSDIAITSGTNGVNDWSARYAAGAENWSYRLSAGQRSDRGFDGQPDSSRVEHFNFRGRHRLDAANELAGTFLHSNGVGTEYYSIERPRYFIQDAVQLCWTKATGADEFWLQFHHSQRQERERYGGIYELDLSALGLGTKSFPYSVNFDNDLRRDELAFQQSFGGSEQWRLVWGGQLRQDAVRSATVFDRSDWLTNQLENVFASSEWRPWKQLLLHAGATYEHSSLSGGSISPRISATAFLAEGQSIRIGISKARRMPTPYEEFADESYAVPTSLHALLVGIAPMLPPSWRVAALQPTLVQAYLSSGGLRDEKILSRELAYLGNWPSLRLSGEVRWFNDQVRDLIYVHRIEYPSLVLLVQRANNPYAESTTFDFRNMDIATERGVEGSLRWTPWQGADLMVAAARTVIKSSDIDASYSASAPLHTASALFSQQLPWDTSVSLGYYRVGEMQWLGGGEPLPAYERIDIRLGKRFRWGRQTGELSWTTQNVLNNNHPDFQLEFRNKRISWLKFQYSF